MENGITRIMIDGKSLPDAKQIEFVINGDIIIEANYNEKEPFLAWVITHHGIKMPITPGKVYDVLMKVQQEKLVV